jgi:hypothetical protein
MTASTIDHLIAVTVFLAAMLLFVGLFNQTIQTAILYQEHRTLATKCSDLLDNILLSPGNPMNWGQTDVTPSGFGLQDPEFTQYRLSPFSLMRLQNTAATPITYRGRVYSNITMGFGNYLLVPYAKAINYALATKLLGTNNTLGFQLTIAPVVTVQIIETSPGNPLNITISATGTGTRLSNATVNYCFITVEKGPKQYPSYDSVFGVTYTDTKGEARLSLTSVKTDDAYLIIAYVHLGGLMGIGYHERVNDEKQYVVPLLDSFADRRVTLAHSYNVHDYGPPESSVFFNATFVLMTEDYTLREMPLENSTGKIGKVVYGQGVEKQNANVTIPTYDPGILIVTYKTNNGYGIVMMPWGLSAMAFPVTFGGSTNNRDWIATDLRQTVVSGITYQAKLALWSLKGHQVIA